MKNILRTDHSTGEESLVDMQHFRLMAVDNCHVVGDTERLVAILNAFKPVRLPSATYRLLDSREAAKRGLTA